jgi:hypothetical protein
MSRDTIENGRQDAAGSLSEGVLARAATALAAPQNPAPAPAQRAPEASPAAPRDGASAYVHRSTLRRYQEELETALGRLFSAREQRRAWRFAEAERRITELEARIAKLEEQNHGQG